MLRFPSLQTLRAELTLCARSGRSCVLLPYRLRQSASLLFLSREIANEASSRRHTRHRCRRLYTYTRSGSPLTVKAPKEPGNYELRYVTAQDKKVLARLPITVN